ncbi:MAG TPA: class I SAM-dependent methyltransferase [bacterium]|nr:class I SAM-dependent methyltransferase [bacterium]
MTKRWQEYFQRQEYKHHSVLDFAVNHWNYNEPLYFRIKRLMQPPARILDVGCGLGYSDIYLQKCGYEVVGIDDDANIVEKARKNAEYFRSNVKFEQVDAFDLSKYYGKFDLVYSVGVVEHFDRKTTIVLLKEQAKCAKYMIAVIPTKFTRYSGEITDERIYTISQLRGIFKYAGLEVIGKFGYGNIVSPFHNWVHRLLPHGLYRILQNNFSYAMGIGCIGKKK